METESGSSPPILGVLLEVSNQLALSRSIDDLCRQAVELGRHRLGLDRLSLWFFSPEEHVLRGSYGTDEQGRTRDERQSFRIVEPEEPPGSPRLSLKHLNSLAEQSIAQRAPGCLVFEGSAGDHQGHVLGRATRIVTALWDGTNMIGFLTADNLVRQKPFQPEDLQVIRLYAATVGHLVHRLRVEEQLRQSHAALQKQRDLLRAVADSIPDPIFVKDEQRRFIFANQAKIALLPLRTIEELTGRTDAELGTPTEADRIRQSEDLVLKEGAELRDHHQFSAEVGGSTRVYSETQVPLRDAQGRIVGIVGVQRDITEQRRQEEQRLAIERRMLEAQRMESLGMMAGGIAHDFNNMLMGMLGHTSLALMSTPDDSPARPHLEGIEKTSLQAAELCQQMLAYSGRGRFELRRINLNELVQDMRQLFDVSVKKKVALHHHFATTLPAVEADVSQLRQVVLNLVINGSDAIGDRVGHIAIRTGVLQAGPNYFQDAVQAPVLPPGPYVFIEVSDTGCGIDPSVLPRIFDPFFSTKFSGRGLGLAAVLGIIHSHRGAMKVWSESGQGSRFTVFIPAIDAPAERLKKPVVRCPEISGEGTVLVVDDDETVRVVISRMLGKYGFRVLQAQDGDAGVEMFRLHADSIRLVLLDMNMPQMSGEEALLEIRRIRKDTAVVIMSGYNEWDATQRFSGLGLASFLQKPFRPAELQDKLQALLH